MQDGGATCITPTVRYGTTSGGVPADASELALEQFCQQLGFSGYASHTLAPRPCEAPAGLVFWGSGYDEDAFHWIDFSDGFWRDATLDEHTCNASIATLTCVQ